MKTVSQSSKKPDAVIAGFAGNRLNLFQTKM
jgi:hypothetical protein